MSGFVQKLADLRRKITSPKTYLQQSHEDDGFANAHDTFEIFANTSNEWEYLVNPGGKDVYVTPACERLTGYSADEFLKDPLLKEKIVHPNDRLALQEHHRDALNQQSGDVCRICFRIIPLNGIERWVEHYCRPVYGKNGKSVIGRRVCNRDITNILQVENSLIESEKYLSAILTSIGDAVIVTDAAGCVTRMNPVAETLTGWLHSEAFGKHLSEIYSIINQQTREPIPSPLEDVLRTGKPHDLANGTALISKNGQEYIIADSMAPIFESESSVIRGTVMVFRDVTKEYAMRSSLKESEERFRMLANRIPLPIWTADNTKAYDWLSAGWLQFSGRQMDLDLGHAWLDHVHPDDRDTCFKEYVRSFDAHASFRIRFRMRSANGEFRIFENCGAPRITNEGQFLGYVGAMIDQTEILRITDELRAATEQAKASNNAKSAFLATMSHELRTPMNAVLGFAELLLSTPLTDEQGQFVRTMQNSGEMLVSIINDILDYSKIESGKMDLDARPFQLQECLDEVMKMFALNAKEKNISLRCDIAEGTPFLLIGDVLRLKQILINLVSNAIKFTDSGSVTVSVKATEDGLPEIGCPLYRFDFSVEDTGIGISHEIQNILFQPFIQADSSHARVYGGTGLGLAICRKLSELMRGSIRVESLPSHGSSFHFSIKLPARTISPAHEQSLNMDADKHVAASESNKDWRVWVVDDVPANLKLVEVMLCKAGYSPVAMSSGQEVLNRMRKEMPDIIFMDIEMPGKNGLDTTIELRSIEKEMYPEKQPARIIGLSAHTADETEKKCLQAGMDMFWGKPVRYNQLLEIMEESVAEIKKRRANL